MKGNNTLTLNQATIVEAVQLWVNATFKNPPKVERVEQTSAPGGAYSSSEVFEVKMSEPEQTATPT